MSVAGVPVQLMNQTFDFALLTAIKGFWKEYKPTFSLAQLITALHENEQLWLASKQRNYNDTTYRTSLHLSLERLTEHAGIIKHCNIIPHLYELVDYAAFQNYEQLLVTTLFPQLISIELDEKLDLPFMSERSYQLWLLKQHDNNNLKYSVTFENHANFERNPCLKVLILTDKQLSYLVRKAIRFNLIQLPPFSNFTSINHL